ncbi:flagellar protein FlgN [Steroidobacter sp. S1-65]|uniref:Flagellar protein FlgN n=1 Tax=Steroidobacter gossypii TaxID=2805490 RepID=A0ABS1X518_9GAMM|nr:flagellar protein FlgN [Steroidobacter gossypii]MBM0108298.1 flagellar protein FlgN [Steroidobacter gossypii]
MDPVACRDHLDKLIAEESNTLEQLQTLLDREHELLVANDVEALDRAAQARQNCIGTLLRIEDERKSLCRALNVPADMHGLDRILAWCDPSKQLRLRWKQLGERASRCRSANDRNGALVTARLNRVQGMLDVVTGRADQPKVYGRQGAFQNQPRTGRVLVSV